MKWLSDDNINHLRELTVIPDFTATKYRLSRDLASGGMGTVYLAEDTELNRQVAIKALNSPEITSELRQRMVREAQIIAQLEHPGIVPVHDVGVLPDGRAFYSMKYVRGKRLDEYAAETDSLRARLRKFQGGGEGVAFGSRDAVVYRGLKAQDR